MNVRNDSPSFMLQFLLAKKNQKGIQSPFFMRYLSVKDKIYQF